MGTKLPTTSILNLSLTTPRAGLITRAGPLQKRRCSGQLLTIMSAKTSSLSLTTSQNSQLKLAQPLELFTVKTLTAASTLKLVALLVCTGTGRTTTCHGPSPPATESGLAPMKTHLTHMHLQERHPTLWPITESQTQLLLPQRMILLMIPQAQVLQLF